MGLVQKENLVVFYIRVPWETERQQRKKWGTQKDKGKEQASSSVPTGKGQTDVKSSTSLEASPATGAKIPCLWGQHVKDRRVMFDILPCVVITSLETGAFMSATSCIDMLMVRRNPARSQRKKRVLKKQLRF